MENTAADTLIRTNLEFLRRHAPFDRMEAEALRFLGERLATAFYPAESEILMPEDGPPRFFYIVYRGKVQARQMGGVAVTEYATLTLGPGEGFPIGAISAERRSTNSYIAVEDSYCFQLPAADFLRLQELSPSFQIFCTRYIASLMSQSREQLQVQFAQRAAEHQGQSHGQPGLVGLQALHPHHQHGADTDGDGGEQPALPAGLTGQEAEGGAAVVDVNPVEVAVDHRHALTVLQHLQDDLLAALVEDEHQYGEP